MRHFGHYRCKRNNSTNDETFLFRRSPTWQHKIDDCPVVCLLSEFMSRIWSRCIDLDQMDTDSESAHALKCHPKTASEPNQR
jgi:hypothetical protein